MKKPTPITPFKTLADEAHFWDTHSVVKSWNEQSIVQTLKQETLNKDTVIHVKINSTVKKLLEKKAKAQASTISALLRLWVYQKLSETMK